MTTHMTDMQEAASSLDTQAFASTARLPELIRTQMDKLKELDDNVQSALSAAGDAEISAKKAQALSADRGFFTDKKRTAIEGLQAAGIELAKAVQTSAKAQKTAFEFQERLAEISSNLFGLGLQNIAARQIVVRELEARLKGASEEELSELARQELLGVVRQLKEQESLLRKQDALKEQQDKLASGLASHDKKIAYLLQHTDDLHAILVGRIGGLEQETKRQEEDIQSLRQHMSENQAQVSLALTEHGSALAALVERAGRVDLKLNDHAEQLQVSASKAHGLGKVVEERKEETFALRQQISEQQLLLQGLSRALALAEAKAEQATAGLSSSLDRRVNVLLAVSVTMAMGLAVAMYFLH